MTFVRNLAFVATAAALLGAGSAVGLEVATQWAPVSRVASTAALPGACTKVPPQEDPDVEVCVEPIPASAADDFIRSILAAFVGGLVGVGTFLAGQMSAKRRETRSGQVAVRMTRKELQANRLAMNNALAPAPAGVSPISEHITISVFPTVQAQLADRLPYDLFTRTYLLYGRLTELLTKDLRKVDRETLEQLRDDNETLDEDLRRHDIS